MRAWVTVLLLAGAVALQEGCAGGGGDQCKEGNFRCSAGGDRMERCDGTTFQDLRACPRCSVNADAIQCDWEPGDACVEPNYVCDSSTAALECRGGTMTSVACRGPDGCLLRDSVVYCDSSSSNAGDACFSSVEGNRTCEAGNQNRLRCISGTWTQDGACTNCRLSLSTTGGVLCD